MNYPELGGGGYKVNTNRNPNNLPAYPVGQSYIYRVDPHSQPQPRPQPQPQPYHNPGQHNNNNIHGSNPRPYIPKREEEKKNEENKKHYQPHYQQYGQGNEGYNTKKEESNWCASCWPK